MIRAHGAPTGVAPALPVLAGAVALAVLAVALPAGNAAPDDLSGIWHLELAAQSSSNDFICRMLPTAREALVDTVTDISGGSAWRFGPVPGSGPRWARALARVVLPVPQGPAMNVRRRPKSNSFEPAKTP